MNTKTDTFLRTRLAAGVALALAVTGVANADILTFEIDAAGGPMNTGGGLFTILTSSLAGTALTNSSQPYSYDSTWGYGKRTQFGGSLTYNTTSGTGTMVVNPFEFFSAGPAVASDITVEHLGGAGNGNLILANMLFEWNGTVGIPVSQVWDATGFLGQIVPGLNEGDIVDSTGGATPATDTYPANNNGSVGIYKGKLPIGPVPLATTTYDTTLIGSASAACANSVALAEENHGNCLTLNPSASGWDGADDLVGGSPMIDGPFTGNNANFDVTELILLTITPEAIDDDATALSGVAVSIPVATNDIGTLSVLDPASVAIVDGPTNGMAVANGDGTITYTPNFLFGGGGSVHLYHC